MRERGRCPSGILVFWLAQGTRGRMLPCRLAQTTAVVGERAFGDGKPMAAARRRGSRPLPRLRGAEAGGARRPLAVGGSGCRRVLRHAVVRGLLGQRQRLSREPAVHCGISEASCRCERWSIFFWDRHHSVPEGGVDAAFLRPPTTERRLSCATLRRWMVNFYCASTRS